MAPAENSSKTIGLILPNSRCHILPYFARAIHRAQKVLGDRGYAVTLYTEDDMHGAVGKAENPFPCTGFVVFSPWKDWHRYLQQLRDWDLPCSLVRRTTPVEGVVSLHDNDYNGTRLAMEYLYSLGHSVIGHIGRWNGEVITTARYKAYAGFLEEKNLRISEDLIYYQKRVAPGITAYQNWIKYFNTWVKKALALPDPPTAFFCYGDEEALYLMNEIWKCGKRIPDDVSIVGYDNSLAASAARPPITSINLPIEAMCEAACRIVAGESDPLWDGKSKIEFANELVVRQSCRDLNADEDD